MNIRVTPIPNAEPGADVLRDGTAEIPAYLEKVYWWTYVRPWAVRFFERQWLVNAILFGNYVRLRDAALELLGARLPGKTLADRLRLRRHDLSACRARRAGDGRLDVVDVLPGQIENLRDKLPAGAPVRGLVHGLCGARIFPMAATIARSCSSCCTSSRKIGGGRP